MAKTFLGPNDTHFTVANSNTTIFGAIGEQIVTILPNVSNVQVDQNVEGVVLPGSPSDFSFLQTGNVLKVYENGNLITDFPVQIDNDGTQISFSDGESFNAILNLSGNNAGRMTIGNSLVSNTDPEPLQGLSGGNGNGNESNNNNSGNYNAINISEGINSYSGTSSPDEFKFDAVAALQDVNGTNTQATIVNFDVSNDLLDIIMSSANSSVSNLSQLDGVDGIHLDYDPFDNTTIIGFGNDQNGGEAVTISLVGITQDEWSQVHVQVEGS